MTMIFLSSYLPSSSAIYKSLASHGGMAYFAKSSKFSMSTWGGLPSWHPAPNQNMPQYRFVPCGVGSQQSMWQYQWEHQVRESACELGFIVCVVLHQKVRSPHAGDPSPAQGLRTYDVCGVCASPVTSFHAPCEKTYECSILKYLFACRYSKIDACAQKTA